MTEQDIPSGGEAIDEPERLEDLQVDPEIDFYPEVADREPGDTNLVGRWFDIHPQVTFWAVGFLVAFIAWTLLFPDQAAAGFDASLSFVNDKFG